MKKWLIICWILVAGLILVACGSKGAVTNQADSKSETVFTSKDIQKAEEMVIYLDDKMTDFEKEANSLIQNGDITTDNEDLFDEQVRELAGNLVIQPFLQKYGDSIIPENYKGTEQIHVYFNKTSSEPCSMNYCKYDGIEIMDITYNFKENEEYHSANFSNTELNFNNIKYDYESDDKEVKEATISFVKDKDGNLILTRHPNFSFTTLDFKKYDTELESIKSDVPESEVEAEQAEYKEGVQETLEEFPELQ